MRVPQQAGEFRFRPDATDLVDSGCAAYVSREAQAAAGAGQVFRDTQALFAGSAPHTLKADP
jgi:hypothetical protein